MPGRPGCSCQGPGRIRPLRQTAWKRPFMCPAWLPALPALALLTVNDITYRKPVYRGGGRGSLSGSSGSGLPRSRSKCKGGMMYRGTAPSSPLLAFAFLVCYGHLHLQRHLHSQQHLHFACTLPALRLTDVFVAVADCVLARFGRWSRPGRPQ